MQERVQQNIPKEKNNNKIIPFTFTRKFIKLQPLSHEKINALLPAFNNTFVVSVDDKNSKMVRHISEDRVLDCEYFEKNDDVVSVKMIRENIVLIAYEKQSKSCYVMQWNLQTKSKITLKIQSKASNVLNFSFFIFEKSSIFCAVEHSQLSKRKNKQTLSRHNPNRNHDPQVPIHKFVELFKKQFLQEFVDKKPTYYTFHYYSYPLESCLDKPIVTFYLQDIAISKIDKINEESKIGFVIDNILLKKNSLKFYTIGLQQIDFQHGGTVNGNQRIEQYTFKHSLHRGLKNQEKDIYIEDLYEILPQIFYIKCKINKKCCIFEQNENILDKRFHCTHSYIWETKKHKHPKILDYTGGHQHIIQFLDNFRDKASQQLSTILQKMRTQPIYRFPIRGQPTNPGNQPNIKKSIPIYYVNPYDMTQIYKKDQQLYIPPQRKFLNKQILALPQKNSYMQHFSNNHLQIITFYNLCELIYGLETLIVFILLQMYEEFNEDLVTEVVLLIKDIQSKQPMQKQSPLEIDDVSDSV